MPRYFFHLYDDIVSRDEEGRELPDLATAKEAALKAAQELMCDEVRKGELVLGHRIEVESEEGQVLHVLRFREALKISE